MRKICVSLIGMLLPMPVLAAQQVTPVPPGTPVTITVSPAAPSAPPLSITLKERHGHVTPSRVGFTHTGSGYIDIAQPSPDTVVITMTGVAVAGPHPWQDSVATLNFDLEQCFEVSFDDPKLKKAKFTVEGRVIGLLRSVASKKDCQKGCGSADESCANVAILADGGGQVVALANAPHSVACGENLSLNDHVGPAEGPVVAGKYLLKQNFTITAAHPRGLLASKAASAEFAPDPALDPLWISYWEPFHGIKKADFGYQVTVKVVPDTSEEEKKPEEKKAEPVPAPKAGGQL
jgi:hypothetical protein